MKTNNSLLKGIASNTGSEVTGSHTDNYYLKRIADNTSGEGFSGSYNDLTDKPTIPSDLSDLTDNTNILGLEFVVVTTDKGTASEDTLNKLFIEIGQNSVDVYYTLEEKNGYGWRKMDTDILNDITVPADISDLTDTNNLLVHFSGDYTDLQNKPTIPTDVSDLTDTNGLLTHFSGDYTDLQNKPSIPSKTSDLNNDSGFLTSHQNISGKADKSDFDTLEVEITYEDDSTDTVELYIVPQGD